LDATLIFPHQLFHNTPALKKNRRVFILRDPLFFNDNKYPVKFHKNKILLHLLSTANYKEELSSRGYDVVLLSDKVLKKDDPYESFIIDNNISEIH
tara:strand:+ start:240 stop:527 length:288 start_codon:yes stop_codon:yes gene_type:complete